MSQRRGPRRVSKPSEVVIRRKGLIKNWDTTEICTSNFREVAKYLRQFDPYGTRVWISAYGFIHVMSPKRKRRGVKPMRGHDTLVRNTQLHMLGRQDVIEQMYQRRKAFLLPEYQDKPDSEIESLPDDAYDIEYWCVRTREAID